MTSTARLVETVGAAWARWILLTGDPLDADEALRIGLIHEVHAPDAVQERAYALARTLAARARISLAGGKELISRAAHGQLTEDAEVQALYAQSLTGGEYAEGVAAFLAKRPVNFRAARPAGPELGR